MDRRRLVLGGAGLAVLAVRAPARASEAPLSPDRLARTLRRYASEGFHRTGSEVDRRTTDWMAEALRQAGLDVSLPTFEVDTYATAEARLTLRGASVDCAVQWPSPVGRSTLTAPVRRSDDRDRLAGAIAVLPQPNSPAAYWPAQADALVADLAAAGAVALIASVATPNGMPFLFNRSIERALPIPVITTGPGALAPLLEAVEDGESVSLSLALERFRAETRNVVATFGDRAHGVVLSTPLTGWFQCGSERGPGVALAMALAESLASANVGVTLVGSAGHEIGHLGMDRLLHDPELAARVAPLWVHLGSSIAALARPETPSVFATSDLLARTRSDVEALGLTPIQANASTPGETGTIIGSGRRSVIGFAGAGRAFHTAGDDGSDVDIGLLSRIGGFVHDLALKATRPETLS